jgi:hypothetical protein
MNPRIQDLLARLILGYALLTAPLEVAAVALLFYVAKLA